jgi:RimJ/RimL family protein N-acetyltransferase
MVRALFDPAEDGAPLGPDFLRQDTPEHFHTPRLWLEKIHIGHADALRSSVLRSQSHLHFVDWSRGAWDRPQALRFCRHSREAMDRDGRFVTYLVFERLRRPFDAPVASRGDYVGLLDLHGFDFSVPSCQIGYVGDAVRQGQGLMREAAQALIAQAYAWGVTRIEAWCDARNLRSQQFARSLGFALEGRLRAAARDADGALCDQLVLARLAGDASPA